MYRSKAPTIKSFTDHNSLKVKLFLYFAYFYVEMQMWWYALHTKICVECVGMEYVRYRNWKNMEAERRQVLVTGRDVMRDTHSDVRALRSDFHNLYW